MKLYLKHLQQEEYINLKDDFDKLKWVYLMQIKLKIIEILYLIRKSEGFHKSRLKITLHYLWNKKQAYLREFKKLQAENNCLNCKHCVRLHKFPANSDEKLRGKISEQTGLYCCTAWNNVPEHIGINEGIVMEENQIHGMCEMWQRRVLNE